METQLLTPKEVAELLRVSKRQVSRLASSGKIPAAVRVGGSVRYRHRDVARWIEAGCVDRVQFEALSERQGR
jgi:excisionase family DNA binding protein